MIQCLIFPSETFLFAFSSKLLSVTHAASSLTSQDIIFTKFTESVCWLLMENILRGFTHVVSCQYRHICSGSWFDSKNFLCLIDWKFHFLFLFKDLLDWKIMV